MSDKHLSEQEWKKAAKGREIKDASFIKALVAVDKARDPATQLAALGELDKQLQLLRKSISSDKELTRYLDEVSQAAERERKATEKSRESDGEDEDSPALLGTKMIAVLKAVRKGEACNAVVAIAGKECSVLVSRKAIGPSQRKLMATALGVGGVRYVPGECIWEESAHTFVLKTQAAGLAKRIKAALLVQTETRFKVRVRGEDPSDIDDDGEAPEAEQEQEQEHKLEGADSEEAKLQTLAGLRVEAMTTAVLAALKSPRADAGKLRAVADFMREKFDGGNFKAALAAAEQLVKLLAAAPPVAAEAASAVPLGTNPGSPPGAKLVDYAKCRLAWESAKSKVHSELQKLEQAILSEYQGAKGIDEITVRLRKVDTVLDDFAEDLSDTLDRALNEADPEARQRYHREAAGQIRRFLDRATNDPFIAQLETNPFVPIKAQATLVTTLGTLAKLIA